MSIFFAEEAFEPEKLDMALVGLVEYWYDIAEQAVGFFYTKEPFMNWVCSHYFDELHRFAASACWDIVILEEYGEDLD